MRLQNRKRFFLYNPDKTPKPADGSFENPYLIHNVEEWNNYANNDNIAYANKWWRLENDIVLKESDFKTKQSVKTVGNLNGNGFKISGITNLSDDQGVLGAVNEIIIINTIFNVSILNATNTSIAFRESYTTNKGVLCLNCMSLDCVLQAKDSISFFAGTDRGRKASIFENIVINGGEERWQKRWEFTDINFSTAQKINNCFSDSSINFKTRKATPKTNEEINSQATADTLNKVLPQLEQEYNLPAGALKKWFIKDGKLILEQKQETIYLSDLNDKLIVSNTLHGGLKKDRDYADNPLEIWKENGETETFLKGIGVHGSTQTTSEIIYSIENQGFLYFEAWLGTSPFQTSSTSNGVNIQIFVDDTLKDETGKIQPQDKTPAKFVHINLANAKQLKIKVNCYNNNMNGAWANIADAKFLKEQYKKINSIWSVVSNNIVYFNTKYKPNEKTKVIFKTQFKAEQGKNYKSGFICGEDMGWRRNGFAVFIRNPWRMISEWNNGNMGESAIPSLEQERKITFFESKLYVDNQYIGNGGGTQPFGTHIDMLLFCNNRNGGKQEPSQGFSISKYFNIIEVENGVEVPVMKLIPVLKNNTPCFLETITGMFLEPFENTGLLRFD